MDITREVLNKDSIYETEKFLGGKDYHKFDDTENAFMLRRFIKDNENKANHLKSIGDTYWGIPWNEFKLLITQCGFINGYSYDLIHDNKHEEYILYYHPQYGLILQADSYWGMKNINGGTVYGIFQFDKFTDNIWNAMEGCSNGPVNNHEDMHDFSFDVREGFVYKLNKIIKNCNLLKQWPDDYDRFLYFVDYNESDVKGYDYETLTQSKIEKCTQELRDIIRR